MQKATLSRSPGAFANLRLTVVRALSESEQHVELSDGRQNGSLSNDDTPSFVKSVLSQKDAAGASPAPRSSFFDRRKYDSHSACFEEFLTDKIAWSDCCHEKPDSVNCFMHHPMDPCFDEIDTGILTWSLGVSEFPSSDWSLCCIKKCVGSSCDSIYCDISETKASDQRPVLIGHWVWAIIGMFCLFSSISAVTFLWFIWHRYGWIANRRHEAKLRKTRSQADEVSSNSDGVHVLNNANSSGPSTPKVVQPDDAKFYETDGSSDIVYKPYQASVGAESF